MKILKILDKYLICFVLTAVALFQLYNSQFDGLNPWKGGGFGMFSTNKKNNITAIGYTSEGDSVLIKIVGSKLDIPISNNFLRNLKYYPKKEGLLKLGKLILNSHLKPSLLNISEGDIDSKSYNQIKKDSAFYSKVYVPKYYPNTELAKMDNALRIEKIIIHMYEMNFYNDGLKFKKNYVQSLEVHNDKHITYVLSP